MSPEVREAAPGPADEPSLGFEERVMAAVRREARIPPPIPFPWRRLALGMGAGVAISAVAVAAIATSGDAAALASGTSPRWIAALAGGALVSAIGLRWSKLVAST